MRIILASKSPRRRELLSSLFDKFDIISREVDESLESDIHPADGVRLLAIRKGAAVYEALLRERTVASGDGEASEDFLVLSSDTLVELSGVALGKPEDEEDAKRMLRSLSGKAHNVHTGVAIHYKDKLFAKTATTAVYFREMTEEEISDYVASGEPMDKAGAYGIQGLGGKFVSHYEGDFDTVVGLSMRVVRELYERAISECGCDD